MCCISLSHNLCCSDKSHSYWSNLVLDLYNFVSFPCILQRTSWNNHPNHSKMSIRHHLSEISSVELVMWFIDWSVFNTTVNNISALSVIWKYFPLISRKPQTCHTFHWQTLLHSKVSSTFRHERPNIWHHDSLYIKLQCHGKCKIYISYNLSLCSIINFKNVWYLLEFQNKWLQYNLFDC